MPTVIVPVGLDMGPVYDEEGPPDRAPLYYEVHLGGDPQQLNPEGYTAWLGAFHNPDQHANHEMNRERLEQYLRDNVAGPVGRLSDPGPLVQTLLDVSLLIEFDPDKSDMEYVFGPMRLYPRAHGLGSTSTVPDQYRIGYVDHPFAQVSELVYELWSFSLTMPSLWTACEEVSNALRTQVRPGEEPVDYSAEELARDVAYTMPLLVSSGAAILDLINYEPPRVEPAELDRRARLLVSRRSDPSSREVIVPVGLAMGQDFAESGPPEHWEVHLGYDRPRLAFDEARVWGSAGLHLEKHARHEVTRYSLRRYLEQNEPDLRKPDAVIAELLKRGLLLEYDPFGADLEELFRAYQVYPLGDGMGCTADDPAQFWVGIAGDRQVALSPHAYTIWSYSMTGPSLWEACTTLATGLDEDLDPGEQPYNFDPEDIARDFAAHLPPLVAAGCAFLDPLNYRI